MAETPTAAPTAPVDGTQTAAAKPDMASLIGAAMQNPDIMNLANKATGGMDNIDKRLKNIETMLTMLCQKEGLIKKDEKGIFRRA